MRELSPLLLALGLGAALALGLPVHADGDPPNKPVPAQGPQDSSKQEPPKPAPPKPAQQKPDPPKPPPAKPESDGAKGGAKPKAAPKQPGLARVRKVLDAVGAEFKAKDAAALVARIEKGGKAELTVAGKTGQYRAQQAKKNLQGWFDRMRSISSTKLDRVSGLHGSFTVKGRIKGRDAVRTFALTVELREVKSTSKGAPSKLYLRKIAVRVLEAKPRARKP